MTDCFMDHGEQKSQKGKWEYGWDNSNVANTRKRNLVDNPLLDNLILFQPDTTSKWCSDQLYQGKIQCAVNGASANKWSITVPNGSYAVQLTIGDPEYTIGYSLQVNGEEMIAPENRIIPKDTYLYPKTTLKVTNNLITVRREAVSLMNVNLAIA